MRGIALAILVFWPGISFGFELELPLDCELGKTCVIQQYVDHDPSGGAADYRCGSLSYNGHNGTDFRVPSLAAMRAGVDVRASAAGRVLRVRDGVPDKLQEGPPGADIAGRECGNGVVIGHDEGYETQYCHMAQGSIVVRPGEMVSAGQKIGRVGLSGHTQFPHVHISVRKGQQMIDPFAPSTSGEPAVACKGSGASLWSPHIAGLEYRPVTVLNTGFSSGAVRMSDVEEGTVAARFETAPEALVAYARVLGLQGDDIQRLTVQGPAGAFVDSGPRPVDSNKAQSIFYVGRKMNARQLSSGEYKATYSVTRAGSIIATADFTIQVPQAQSIQ